MRLTSSMLDKAMKLHPSGTGQRLILDPRGIHHKTIPARNFAQTVANHAEVRKVSIAESLFIVERLSDLGAISQGAVVSGQGAVFQSFHGTKGYEGCHSMPCQLMVNGIFPHQLRDGNGHTFNTTFLHRTINMCTRSRDRKKVPVNGYKKTL